METSFIGGVPGENHLL